MKTIGNNGLKWLKITHIVLVALFFGGIMSSVAIHTGIKLDSYEVTLETYKRIVVISDYVIRTGAVGTLIVGFIYGIFTKWGFFKHRWVTVKWILFIIQTVVGIFVVDHLMMTNMALLEKEKALALSNPAFIQNDEWRQYAVWFQVGVTLFIFIISVLKPWKKKRTSTKVTAA
ncbi:DUF2269 family protein [Fictibacillus phosphorivorans]|uniref:DUF2269 family protein n=1 Tax=Fictibacillus phosphorivorans TaxID=1221500 RepID=UPI002042653F|nr:DUF2269 family protein [Fictibacillus phosphorivorans]MCM3718865.1 DUF2269 family protein [Fictibacillus phosphorivorans]MCM3776487.1 DUF2269 family protein [Fictibacillus phosphorivorans]